LVEDEELVRSLAKRVLERKGYRVFTALSAADALELFPTIPVRVELVVTDVVMPGMGGRELAERLRDRQPGLRVLFMSGYTTDEVLRQGIEAEAEHFIQKPFTPDGLARKVRDVLLRPTPTPTPLPA
jgi:CheY-like chemotaxis protein